MRSASGSTVILVPTCDRYRALADLTTSIIDRFWSHHPAIHYCGVADAPDPSWLPMARHFRDWIGIVRDACVALESRGATLVYLILDDHPPIDRCQARHLNHTLPEQMDTLGADCICLNGWERYGRQGRLPVGEMVRDSGVVLERLPEDFRWRFSLHPALWRVAALVRLLDRFCERYPEQERTPWLFERQAVELSRGLLDGAVLRVGGASMTADGARRRRHVTRVSRLRLLRKLGSASAAAALDDAVQYYEGPYPLYWSGLVSGGRHNEGLYRFLAATGREPLAVEMRRQAVEGFGVGS